MVTEWFWIIGIGLTGWTFLTILAGEMQCRVQESDAKHAAQLAADAAKAAPPPLNPTVSPSKTR